MNRDHDATQGCTDVDLIERIAQAYPKLPVLVLTMHAAPHIARRALEAGAGGYLSLCTRWLPGEAMSTRR